MTRGRGNRGGVGRNVGGRGRCARLCPLPPTLNAAPHLPTITPPIEMQSTPNQQPEVMHPVQGPSIASVNIASTTAENALPTGSSQQSDSQVEASVTRGHPIPADPLGTNRKWVTITRGILGPSTECSRRIRSIFEERFDDDGARWPSVSNETKEFYFEEFKKYFYWNPAIDHLVKEAWLTKASTRYGDMICRLKNKSSRPKYVPESVWTKWKEAWREPNVVRISQQNAKNRRGGSEDGLCPSTHCGGSISHFEHGKRLEQQYDRPPTPFEVFRRTHTKNGDGQTFTSNRARTINDRYLALVEDRSRSEGTTLDENQLYYEAAGGAKKNRVCGLGTQASYYYPDASSSSCSASNAHNARDVQEQVDVAISSIRTEMQQREMEMQQREAEMHQREENMRASFETRFQQMQRQFEEQMRQMLASRPLPEPTDHVVHPSPDGI